MDEAGKYQWPPWPLNAPQATVPQPQQNFAPQFQHQLGRQEPTQGFSNTAPTSYGISGLMAAQQNQPFTHPQQQMYYASSSCAFQPGNQQLVPQNYHQALIGCDQVAHGLHSIFASQEAEKMKLQGNASTMMEFSRIVINANTDLMSDKQRLELEIQIVKDENRKLKDELQNLRAKNLELQNGNQELLETRVPKDVFDDMVNQVAQKNMQLDDLTKKLNGLNKDRT